MYIRQQRKEIILTERIKKIKVLIRQKKENAKRERREKENAKRERREFLKKFKDLAPRIKEVLSLADMCMKENIEMPQQFYANSENKTLGIIKSELSGIYSQKLGYYVDFPDTDNYAWSFCTIESNSIVYVVHTYAYGSGSTSSEIRNKGRIMFEKHFIEDFPKFEKKFYEWFDSFYKKRRLF